MFNSTIEEIKTSLTEQFGIEALNPKPDLLTFFQTNESGFWVEFIGSQRIADDRAAIQTLEQYTIHLAAKDKKTIESLYYQLIDDIAIPSGVLTFAKSEYKDLPRGANYVLMQLNYDFFDINQ